MLKTLSGGLLASTVANSAEGAWRLSLPAPSTSESVLRLEAVDGNGPAGDYRDLFTGRLRSLDTPLRDYLTFSDDPSRKVLGQRSGSFTAHLSPVTELLDRLVESGPGPGSTNVEPEAIALFRSALAELLGLEP